MAYRLLKKTKELGVNSQYAFVVDNNGIKEFATKVDLDAYVEDQLNLGVPKTSLEAVDYIEYTVSADIN